MVVLADDLLQLCHCSGFIVVVAAAEDTVRSVLGSDPSIVAGVFESESNLVAPPGA